MTCRYLFVIGLVLLVAACDDDETNNVNNINNANNNNINNADCGDGILEGDEVCDGTNLDGLTCTDLALDFSGGDLACNHDCLEFDTSGCISEGFCGNGIVDGDEVCDSTNLQGQDCNSINPAFDGGILNCSDDCLEFDTSQCVMEPECGNGVIEGAEACDGTNLGDNTCSSLNLGFSGGTLACTPNCNWDVSQCVSCGNGTLEGMEVCDGTNLDGNDCTTIGAGFAGGTLECNADCNSFDSSGCYMAVCGDGIIEGDELCDGSNLGGLDCATTGLNFIEGELSCDNCLWDTSQCIAPVCGDGIIEGQEVCDGTNLDGNDCASIGMVSGTLSCSNNCLNWDTSGCEAYQTILSANDPAGDNTSSISNCDIKDILYYNESGNFYFRIEFYHSCDISVADVEHALQLTDDNTTISRFLRFDLVNGLSAVYHYDGTNWTDYTSSLPGFSIYPESGMTTHIDYTIPINQIPILDTSTGTLYSTALILDNASNYDLAPDASWAVFTW